MKKQQRIPRALREKLHGPGVIYYDHNLKKLVVKRISKEEYEQAVKYIKEKAAL